MFKKIIIPVLSLLLISTSAWTQEEAAVDKKMTKKERKMAREKANYEAILELLDEREFVIEAYEFIDENGQTAQVNTSTTFVAVRDSFATMQVTFPNSVGLGYNGLGGVTLDGQVTKLEMIDKDPDKGVTFRLRVFGTGFASADMFVDVFTDGRAMVRYTGTYGANFRLRGYFRSWGQASIFKGSALYR